MDDQGRGRDVVFRWLLYGFSVSFYAMHIISNHVLGLGLTRVPPHALTSYVCDLTREHIQYDRTGKH